MGYPGKKIFSDPKTIKSAVWDETLPLADWHPLFFFVKKVIMHSSPFTTMKLLGKMNQKIHLNSYLGRYHLNDNDIHFEKREWVLEHSNHEQVESCCHLEGHLMLTLVCWSTRALLTIMAMTLRDGGRIRGQRSRKLGTLISLCMHR